MSSFNMPPGCSTRDIPGNDAPEPSAECERVAQWIEKIEQAVHDGPASDDYDNRRSHDKYISHRRDEILNTVDEMASNLSVARHLLTMALGRLPPDPTCTCHDSPEHCAAHGSHATCGEMTLREEITHYLTTPRA